MAPKRALVLSGGGAKGAFTAGVVKYLMVELRLHFDFVIGTSTGALIAPLVASGDIADLVNLYENVRERNILADRPDLLAFLFSNALYDTGPLKNLIRRFFGDKERYRRLIDSPTEVFVTAVNLRTGAIEYGNQHLDTKPAFLQKILASASIPVMMPPVKIGRDQYVDGGVKEIAPFGKAIEEGATHIFSVILSPDAKHREPVRKAFDSSMEILKRTLDLLTDEIVDNDLKVATIYSEAIRYLHQIRRNGEERLGLTHSQIKTLFASLENPFERKKVVGMTTIRPERELIASSLDFDPDRMREMVDEGYQKAKELVHQEIARGMGFFESLKKRKFLKPE